MVQYRNFTVDLPKRIDELDSEFRGIAEKRELEVSYLLMKLSSAFILPYERIDGTSGAKSHDIIDTQRIRSALELDKLFFDSNYYINKDDWKKVDVDNFSFGPSRWFSMLENFSMTVAKVLKILRHSIAHSNLFFGGNEDIEHIYFGNRKERDSKTNKYTVLCCSVAEMNHLVGCWISNVSKLSANPYLIWQTIDKAA